MTLEAFIFILSGQEASCLCLESDNDHSDLQISLLLQLGKHSCAEEDFTLSNPVQIGVQIQMLYLHRQEISGMSTYRSTGKKEFSEYVWEF